MSLVYVPLDEICQFTALGFFSFTIVAVLNGQRTATSLSLLLLSSALVFASQIVQRYHVQHAQPFMVLSMMSSLAGLASILLVMVKKHEGAQHLGQQETGQQAAETQAVQLEQAVDQAQKSEKVPVASLQEPRAHSICRDMQAWITPALGDAWEDALQEGEPTSQWQQVSDTVMSEVLACIGPSEAKSVRLVCRDWRHAVGSSVTHLAPSALPTKQLTRLFPLLKSLDLGACLEDVRAHRLAGLSALSHLTRLELGCAARGVAPTSVHDGCLTTLVKVWGNSSAAAGTTTGTGSHGGGIKMLGLAHCVHVTDYGLLALVSIGSLTCINLSGCVAVSDVALGVLATRLPGMAQLDVPWCLKVSNSGLKALAGAHRSLTSLNISGCPLVGEAGLATLSALTRLSRLSALHLGAAQPAVTDNSLAALAPLSALTSLALGCMQAGGAVGAGGRVSDAGLAGLGPSHPRLQALSLSCLDSIGDAGLGALLEALTALTSLHVRGCPRITAAVLPAVAALGGLQELDLLNCPALELGSAACKQLFVPHAVQRAHQGQGSSVPQSGGKQGAPIHALSLGSFSAGGGSQAQLDSSCLDTICNHLSDTLATLTLTSYTGSVSQQQAVCLTALTALELHGAPNVGDASMDALCCAPCAPHLSSLLLKRPAPSLSPSGLMALAACTSLTALELSHTQHALTDAVAAMLAIKMPGLVSLVCLHALELTDIGVASLSVLTRLTTLDLSYCDYVSGGGFNAWGGQEAGLGVMPTTSSGGTMVRLNQESLLPSNTKLQPGRRHRLRALALNGCSRVGNSGLEALAGGLPSLTRLDLAECPDISDQGVAALSALPLLTSVDLALCSRLTDDALGSLATLSALTTLKLNSCIRLSDAGMGALTSKAGTLLTLHLDKCIKITDRGLQHIAHVTSLTSLRLARCPEITDAGVTALSRLSRLSTLSLAHCTNVTGAGLMALSSLTCLASLEF